ncbi:MAG TPA: hypothetical protein VFU05_04050 [Cyclobacteriaceae bacterium]|nr:hypothetical protein [Cyclobacteriaceae bacterium]
MSSSVFGQDYAFKVMANKGSNEVKSGDSWIPLKTGASLKSTDELKLVDNAYIGLIHASGKPLEVRQSGSYKVADLAAKVGGGSSVINKYTDFILSSNAETKKNKLSATGAVHRATETAAIKVALPEKYADVYNTTAVVNWDGGKALGPYVVVVKNAFDEQLAKFETPESTITIDLSDAKLAAEVVLLVEVSSKNNPKQISKQHMIKKMSGADKEKVKVSLANISGEVSEPTALNKFILAGFYEENNLLIDAIVAYEEAVKLEPSYRESYDEFLLRHGLKK